MVNDIITGIAIALKAYPGAKVYTKGMEQGVELPCFIISLAESSRQKRLHGHYKVTQPFSIAYLNSDESQIQKVAETIPFALEKITASGVDIYGTHITVRIEDDRKSLYCNVNYDYTVKIPTANNTMQNLNYSGGVK